MPTRQAYSHTLLRLIGFLRKKPRTARQIAKEFGCSRPIAYKRIKALIDAGWPVSVRDMREGKTGPLAQAFSVDPTAPTP